MNAQANSQYDRNLQINEWLINARWFYMVAIFLIGIIGNSLASLFEVKFSFFSVGLLLLIFIYINAYFYHALSRIKKDGSEKKLRFFSMLQIGIELAIFTALMNFGGDRDIVGIFYFLPIISAAIIFEVRGAVITGIISAALVNLVVVLNYVHFLAVTIFAQSSFSAFELSEFKYLSISLVQTLTTSNFYLIIALFAGYGIKFLYQREITLMTQTESLVRIKEYRENELKQLDKTTKLLVKRDLALTAINKELDKKIDELEKSEKAMIAAFTDLKAARKKAEEESNKTAAIISNFLDPIIVLDKEGCLALINPAAKDVFGLIDSDLGKKILSENNFSMDNFRAIVKKDYKLKTGRELKSENPGEEELIITYGEQELTYKVITAKVVDRNGQHLGTMKIFYNLTREKMLDRMKSEFISIAAHQLRTPLSAIKWVTKMVLDGDCGPLNEEQKKLLYRGYVSNERIIELVNDMLNVSRIEEGRFGYTFGQSDFREVLDIVLDSLENRIKEKKIKFVLDKPKKLPKVYMDKQKMALVLQNILENAVKYTPEYGTIKVGVEVGRAFLQVKVTDNGVGIPQKDQEKIFSKFFRAANVMRMQTEGSGLGLFIVKNIVNRHGGDITFTSKEGRGTEFVFTLPLNK